MIVFLIFVAYQFLAHLSTTLADLVAQDYSDPNWVVAVSLLHVFDHDVKAIFSYSAIITPRVQLISIRTLELKSVIFSFFYSILKSITLRRIKRDYDNWLSIVKTIIHECQVFIVDLEKTSRAFKRQMGPSICKLSLYYPIHSLGILKVQLLYFIAYTVLVVIVIIFS